uniref:Probable proton-coupled zinc antiporter SLC30A3 n=1 Tax=Anas platyrhynchos platyrhynchos TaxID=8840 RepID=U3IG77_ANAPP
MESSTTQGTSSASMIRVATVVLPEALPPHSPGGSGHRERGPGPHPPPSLPPGPAPRPTDDEGLVHGRAGLAVPWRMAYILHQAPAIHGHGVGGYEHTSVRAAFVHVVGDLLQSIGVLVAATIIYFKPQCKIADPISTLFFSVFVLGSTLTILRDVFRVLMEGAPRGIEFDAVKEVLLAVSGVRGTHDLHIWALTLSHPVVSVHVAVGDANPETVLREATSQLQSKFGFVSCTVQVERYQEEALGCPHCQDPRA